MTDIDHRSEEREAVPASEAALERAEKESMPQSRDQDTLLRRLPGRFLDEASGGIHVEALAQAYIELEEQLSDQPSRVIPDSAADYTIDLKTDVFSSDPEVNKRLHEAGFDQNQAQLVYDLAASHLLPMVAEVASAYEAEKQTSLLRQDFGGDEQWCEVARQMKLWGESHLPEEVFAALASSREGVHAMHKMMKGDEPALMKHAGTDKALLTEAELKQMMRDPRYWRDLDKTIVEKVRDGFRQIYDNEG